MKILKEEFRKAKNIISNFKFKNTCNTELFFPLEEKEQVVDMTATIIVTDAPKNNGYSKLTVPGISHSWDGLEYDTSFAFALLDYQFCINLRDYVNYIGLDNIITDKFTQSDLEWLLSKECYLINPSNIVAQFD